ncbi:MAG: TonB-dependent receptor [Bacteroidetes bacterium]|nr:TonB-dependent receptor [Bacteroidota bacterium]
MARLIFLFLFCCCGLIAQEKGYTIRGTIENSAGEALAFAAVGLDKTIKLCDSSGSFTFKQIQSGKYKLTIQASGYEKREIKLTVPFEGVLAIILKAEEQGLEEVVVTGTMKEINKDDSPVNIDIITPKLFQKTSTPNLFEATSLVNGVKPQINCNVCNTGDIHINGLEGPYTLILIDGMPIVSGLSSVYGLMGIPASMIERLEIAKGPASALYGSEAMGGTINLITKNPSRAPKFYIDYYGTSYQENSLDLSAKLKIGKKANWLIGTNTYYYDKIADINHDNFTDVTLQKRFSLFSKVNVERKDNREFSIAGRYVYEDRWGGETQWGKQFRGGDSVYGESIYAKRGEFIGKYQWPCAEKVFTQISYNLHDQNSYYGVTPFMALQSTAFAQTYWNHQFGKNDFLMGIAYKNLWFDDNTVITQSEDGKLNKPDNTHTTGIFVQNEIALDSASKHKLLLGFRGDYNNVYRFVPSPRLAYKWSPNYRFIMRFNFGTGFRIVNVFTEDHAALTGARTVEFKNKIKPERSYNGSLNVVYKMRFTSSSMIIWDASVFYYYFTNKIYANYDADPNKVIYDNLHGFAFSRGLSLNATLASTSNFKFILGATYADVQNAIKDSAGTIRYSWQLQSPRWSGNIIVSYALPGPALKIDLTGNWYGPQRLPILPKDYRPEFSPWFCLLNLQITKAFKKDLEIYGGVKNLLNFIPRDPIMRPQDPFDKKASDPVNNPNGYTFDPSYNYAPVQGIRGYAGVRWTVR